MLMEGVPPAMIENVGADGRHAGRAAGAQRRGRRSTSTWRILQAAKKDLGPKAVDPDQEKLIEAMVVKEQRFGRKNGKGFYDYPATGAKTLWPGLAKIAGKALDPDTIDVQELKDRFLYTAALEAARCMEENVVTDPREADVGSILGFGFAPFTGGVLSLIDGDRRQGVRRPRRGAGGQIRRALRAGRRAEGDGGEGRDLLRPRRRKGGGIAHRRIPVTPGLDPERPAATVVVSRPPVPSWMRGSSPPMTRGVA